MIKNLSMFHNIQSTQSEIFYKDILYFLYELAQNVKISFLKIQLFMFLCVLKLTTSNELHCIRKVIYPWNILKGFYICLKV